MSRRKTPSPGERDVAPAVTDEFWRIPLVGTSWVDRGLRYWLLRAGWLLIFTPGVVVGVALPVLLAADLARRAPVPWNVLGVAVLVVTNVAAFVASLWRTWPTKANVARSVARGPKAPPRPTGLGSTLGALARAFPPLLLPLIPFAAGAMLAIVAVLLLPRLPRELETEARYPDLLRSRRRAGQPHHR